MRILFVCLGNICRSPAAESIFSHLIKARNAQDRVSCDSAGTASYHQGEKADPRMLQALRAQGYPEPSRSRPVISSDFYNFDLILAMDRSNYNNLRKSCPKPELQGKIKLFCSFGITHEEEVPDPYYGGNQGFTMVIKLVEGVCISLIEDCLNVTSPPSS